jgi:hypothetical protein
MFIFLKPVFLDFLFFALRNLRTTLLAWPLSFTEPVTVMWGTMVGILEAQRTQSK